MSRPHDEGADAGSSLIEIVVSMFLLGLLALAFLPVVAQSLKASAGSTTLATATRLVSDEMEKVRAAAGVCPSNAVTTRTDARGVPLEIRTEATGTCPGLVTYRVAVRSVVPAKALAEATTLVWVQAP